MWLFMLIRFSQIKSSVLQLHYSHFKGSIATSGYQVILHNVMLFVLLNSVDIFSIILLVLSAGFSTPDYSLLFKIHPFLSFPAIAFFLSQSNFPVSFGIAPSLCSLYPWILFFWIKFPFISWGVLVFFFLPRLSYLKQTSLKLNMDFFLTSSPKHSNHLLNLQPSLSQSVTPSSVQLYDKKPGVYPVIMPTAKQSPSQS